jgi:6,7-dimethyl-8-ribityllumazine synthase
MLTTNRARRRAGAAGRFAIVASQYNRRYVDAMLRAARGELTRAGVVSIKVVRVPGAFEIPVVAARLAAKAMPRFSAIICLGVIFRGETTHAQHIGEAVGLALARVQIEHTTPIIHGVYLFENEEQARVRCLSARHGRGVETARTALAMARVMAAL